MTDDTITSLDAHRELQQPGRIISLGSSHAGLRSWIGHQRPQSLERSILRKVVTRSVSRVVQDLSGLQSGRWPEILGLSWGSKAMRRLLHRDEASSLDQELAPCLNNTTNPILLKSDLPVRFSKVWIVPVSLLRAPNATSCSRKSAGSKWRPILSRLKRRITKRCPDVRHHRGRWRHRAHWRRAL